jgi:hypothetical protein
MLEACDEGTTGLPFGCLLTQIIIQSGINIDGEPRMKIKQPLSKQTLMKSYGGKFFSGHGGLSCYSGKDVHYAVVHLLHAAGDAVHQ